jgi:hypothetical protein
MIKSAPKVLREAIKRQRLVPPDFTLPEFELDRLTYDSELRIPAWGLFAPDRVPGSRVWASPVFLRAKRDFDEVMRSLPDGFRRYLRGRARRGRSHGERFGLMASAYDEFCQERKVLRAIVDAASQRDWSVPVPGCHLQVSADKRGKESFNLIWHPLYNEIVRREVEPTYIRECGNRRCRQIFWAGRIDQFGCSPACQQAIRDRRYADKKKEGSPSSLLTEQENMSKVRQAIQEGLKTQEAIIKATKLSLDGIGAALAQLYDQGEVKSRGGKFYLTRNAKNGT